MEELKDRPVMSIASGTKLGSVHDVLLDDSYVQITALVIGGGGLFGGHKQAVAYSAIHGIGPDAVMMSGEDAVQEMGSAGPFRTAHAFGTLQQQVMSESGVNLGRVVGMDFEPQTGAVTGLSFSAPDGVGPDESDLCHVARADIVSMTEKMVIVRHSVVQQTDEELAVEPAEDRGQLMVQEPEGAPGFAPATTTART